MKLTGRTRKALVVLLILFYILSGFFREFIFLNINEQSRVTYWHDTDSHVAPSLSWLSHYSYTTLYYSKWILTFVFAAYFATLASITIHIAFSEKSKTKMTLIAYACVFIAGLLFYMAGSIVGNREATYDMARFLAGLTETPGLLIILFASFIAMRRR